MLGRGRRGRWRERVKPRTVKRYAGEAAALPGRGRRGLRPRDATAPTSTLPASGSESPAASVATRSAVSARIAAATHGRSWGLGDGEGAHAQSHVAGTEPAAEDPGAGAAGVAPEPGRGHASGREDQRHPEADPPSGNKSSSQRCVHHPVSLPRVEAWSSQRILPRFSRKLRRFLSSKRALTLKSLANPADNDL
jgi:hypothetical protein